MLQDQNLCKKNPIFKRVYKTFEQTSISLQRGKRTNKDLVTENTNKDGSKIKQV